jgi:Tol biopolymer transport system component
MSTPFDFDRQLTDWLDAQAPMREPEGLTYAVLSRTRSIRPRPGWASLERWLPMAVIAQPTLAPPLRAAWLLLVTLLILAFVASAIVVGSRLLATSTIVPAGGEAAFAYGSLPAAGQSGDLFIVRADGTGLTQLTSGPEFEWSPAWSPDGTRIAFWQWKDGVDSVVVMDLLGGSRTTIFETDVYSNGSWQLSRDCNKNRDLEWFPDGSAVLITHRPQCNQPLHLLVAPLEGAFPSRLVARGGPVINRSASWSPDGRRLALIGQQGSDDTTPSGPVGLYVADVTPAEAIGGGINPERIGPDLGTALFDGIDNVEWSSDGTEIAVLSRLGTSEGRFPGEEATDQIIAVKPDGSGDPRVIATSAANHTWSPDGKHLAFQRQVEPAEYWLDRPCTVRTWIVDADGTNERALPDLADGCEFPISWSPDGTRVASLLIDPAASQAEGFHLGFANLDGSPALQLQDSTAGSWQPVAAPLPPAPSSAP